MALDKLVDSAQLDAAMRYTANRIRAKTGGSENVPFDMSAENPKGFGDAVDGIQTGGTPTGTKQITVTENGTITEDVSGYATAEITANVSGGVKRTKSISQYKSYGTVGAFLSGSGINLNSLSPYTNYFAHIVFVNNTENTRAGVFVDVVKNVNGFSGNGRRIGNNSGDFSFGVDVYAGASLDITFFPLG